MVELLGSALRFGVVGILATAIHATIFLLLLNLTSLTPTPATVVAFLCAVLVSYSLNHGWTFRARGRHARHFPRFVTLALGGAAVNAGLMHLITDVLGLAPLIGLAAVLAVVPALSFLGNHYWSFR